MCFGKMGFFEVWVKLVKCVILVVIGDYVMILWDLNLFKELLIIFERSGFEIIFWVYLFSLNGILYNEILE